MCMGLAGVYLFNERYSDALKYAKKGIETADDAEIVPSQQIIAQCYYACDSLDKAKDVLKSIQCDSDDYINKYLVLRNLSEVAYQKRDLDSLYIYVDSTYECLENRFFHAQHVKDEYYQSNIAKELEKEQIQREAERSKWILGFIIFFIILLALYI